VCDLETSRMGAPYIYIYIYIYDISRLRVNVIFRRVPKALVKNDYYLLRVRPSIRPSVCLEQRDSQQTNFYEISYLSFLLNFFPHIPLLSNYWQK